MIRFLRSSLYVVCFWSVIAIMGAVCIVVSLIAPRLAYSIAYAWAHINIWILRFVCGIRHEVHGLENIPDEPCVVLMNHQSAWETIVQLAVFPKQTWVMKKQLLFVPFFGLALNRLGAIAIDRSKKREAMAQLISQGRAAIDSGRCVMIFPEGTRVKFGASVPWKKGGAKLAIATNTPVLPVRHNSGQFWKHRSYLCSPGVVHMHIGKPIDPRGKTPNEINELARAWVEPEILAQEKTADDNSTPTAVAAIQR